MTKNNVVELPSREESLDPINELLRAGARSLIESAIAEELNMFIEQRISVASATLATEIRSLSFEVISQPQTRH